MHDRDLAGQSAKGKSGNAPTRKPPKERRGLSLLSFLIA
jgi:hypothetical protein